MEPSNTGESSSMNDPVQILKGHDSGLYSLILLPGNKIASGSMDKTIKIWDSVTCECLHTLRGHQASIISLTALPDGKLASASKDNSIMIWNAETGKCLMCLEGHTSFIYSLTPLPSDKLASASMDNSVRIWDLQSGNCIKTLVGHSDWVFSVVLLPDGRLATPSKDHTIRIWDTTSIFSDPPYDRVMTHSVETQTEKGGDCSEIVQSVVEQLASLQSSDSSAELHAEIVKLFGEISTAEKEMLSENTSKGKLEQLHHRLLSLHQELSSLRSAYLNSDPMMQVPNDLWNQFMCHVKDLNDRRNNPNIEHINAFQTRFEQSQEWLKQEEMAKGMVHQITSLTDDCKKLQRTIRELIHEAEEYCLDHDEAFSNQVEEMIADAQQNLENTRTDILSLQEELDHMTDQHWYKRKAHDQQERLLPHRRKTLINWIDDIGLLKPLSLNKDYHPDPVVIHRSQFGDVLRVRKVADNKEYALKHLQCVTPAAQTMIQNELRTLHHFQSESRVINVNCVFFSEDRSSLYIEMPFIPHNLLEWLKGSPPGTRSSYTSLMSEQTVRSEEEVLDVCSQVIQLLVFFHSQHMEHCDLNLRSLLVDSNNQVLLSNFAMSRNHSLKCPIRLPEKDSDTPQYISPECRKGESGEPHFARDLYALGIVLLESLLDPSHLGCLQVLNVSPSVNQKTHSSDSADGLLPGKSGYLSGWLRDVCVQLLNADPCRRPSVLEVQELFNRELLLERSELSNSAIEPSVKVSLVRNSLRNVVLSTVSSPTYEIVGIPLEDAPHEVINHLSTVEDVPGLLAEWRITLEDACGSGIARYLEHSCVKHFMKSDFMDTSTETGFCTPSDAVLLESQMESIGKMMARCLLRQTPLEWRLSPHIFEVLVDFNGEIRSSFSYLLSCLKQIDPELHSNMKRYMMHPADAGYNSRREAEADMRTQLVEKILGTHHRQANIAALKRGFYSCFDEETKLQLAQLSGEELMILLCDQPELNQENFLEATTRALEDFTRVDSVAHRRTKNFLLRFVRENPIEVLKQLLVLITGWPVFHSDLEFTFTPSNKTMGHTCYRSMEVNCSFSNYERFCQHMHFVLTEMDASGFYG